MRIVIVGGGPAGLYLGLLMKKADLRHDVTVLERNPPDATFGWGVVFSEETLGALRDADRPTFDEITDTFAKWDAIDVRYRGETVRSRGHAFSAIARKRLLGILQRRCADLGVKLRFETEVPDLSALQEADLVVGADGVNSTIRRGLEDTFRPELDVHRTRFVWFGTDLVFTAFTFIFRENEHGLFQVHGYPFDAATSTFIVECPEETWRRAGLDEASDDDSIAYCEKLFADDLGGHSLLSNRSLWINFITLRCQTWHHDNVVLLGDAAHTAHFTIGSGTKLAMEDAVSLASSLERYDDISTALTMFEMERQPVVERFQRAALESSAYFENVKRYAGFEPIQFAFNLLTRSGRITHLELEKRDPEFIRRVDGWYAGRAQGTTNETAGRLVAPPPALAPMRIGRIDVTNRVALSPSSDDDAVEGVPSPALAARLVEAARSGAGLIVTEPVAISAPARITPGTPGLYEDRHVEAWRGIVDQVHRTGGACIGVRLTHAGARGATRPRREGADRPLREGMWPLLAASDFRYTVRSQRPRAMTLGEMNDVIQAFIDAATRAMFAGFDLLEFDLSHGYLLAGFLSPLTNRREDAYGGSLDNRMRYPLEILGAAVGGWPEGRPVAVRLTASDCAPGGFDVADAIVVARALKERGCHLIEVVAGQTIEHDHPDFGRFYLIPSSDRIRNEAGVPTMVGGNLTTRDEVNTILAAGRADLCTLSVEGRRSPSV
jgi:anthraniloyl-CoA monooxygenase